MDQATSLIDVLTRAPRSTCNYLEHNSKDNQNSYCSLERICSPLQVNVDREILYQSETGVIFNYDLASKSDMLNDCKNLLVDKNFQNTLRGESQTLYVQLKKKHSELLKSAQQEGIRSEVPLPLVEKIIKEIELNAKGKKISSQLVTNHNVLYNTVDSIFLQSGVSIPSSPFGRDLLESIRLEVAFLNSLQESDYQTVRKKELIKKSPLLHPEIFVYPHSFGLGEEDVKKNQEEYEKGLRRLNELLPKVQEMVTNLLNEKRDATNSDKIEKMIERIKKVKLNDGGFGKRELIGCDLPNATYHTETHSIKICPQLFKNPLPDLVAILSHEMAHSIDPCFLSGDFLTKVNNGSKKHSIDLRYIIDRFLPDDEERKSGILPSNNPYKSAIACLTTKESIGAQTPIANDVKKRLTEQLNANPLGYRDTQEKRDQRIKDQTEIEVACGSYEAGVSSLGEAFADYISAKVVAGELKKISNPLKKEMYARESLSLFLAFECNKGQGGELKNEFEKILKSHGCYESYVKRNSDYQAIKDKHAKNDTHGSDHDRILKIMSATSEFEDALGCRSMGVHCE